MIRLCAILALLPLLWTIDAGAAARMFEADFESRQPYADPFSIQLDVIFSNDQQSWRVPAFWRGGNKWGVRFTPPTPGNYSYRLECSDRSNPSLNGRERRIHIRAYSGSNSLLQHGALQVSQNRRYFEHADGTPFYWLGDTWWTGLSDRLPWQGFQRLTSDRQAKGFTVVMMSVMAPTNEEDAPGDPGFCNEGGCLWDEDFRHLNPRYFDYADRRIAQLVDAGIAPVIVGAWYKVLAQMGEQKMQRLWREIIARYGAYPVFWLAGGEVYDPPAELKRDWSPFNGDGWTGIVRYIRSVDPYRRPLSVHEIPPPLDTALQDETLTDFDLFQAGHFDWASIATGIALLNTHYARTTLTKPLVLGETGWETFAGQHWEGFQRAAFWTAMLNGAAGFSYGNAVTGESYSSTLPFQKKKYSFLDWDEGMNFPSPAQIGRGACLLRKYPWHRFVPRPDWITPRGTTLLEPQQAINEFDINVMEDILRHKLPEQALLDVELPTGEWRRRHGDARLPYAAGIPNQVRVVYIPSRGLVGTKTPTLLSLEPDVTYRAYYWEPTLGVRVDLGRVRAKPDGNVLYRQQDRLITDSTEWIHIRGADASLPPGRDLVLLKDRRQTNAVISVAARGDSDAGVVLRYRNADNYLFAGYSARQKTLQLVVRRDGKDGEPMGVTDVSGLAATFALTVEVRNGAAIVSATDGAATATSPIVDVPFDNAASDADSAGQVGVVTFGEGTTQSYANFQLRESLPPIEDTDLDRQLYDASGRYRGALTGKHWAAYATSKIILLNAYRPEKLPFAADWVLVLDALK